MDKYEEIINWLFVQLPNYQDQGKTAYKPGLDAISTFLEGMGNPQNDYPSIHVAGTNGKGSVVHMLSAIYQSAGYKTGIFCSPHIFDFRERIKINGEKVSKEFVVSFIDTHRNYIEENQITFFEITTAMAFEAFKKNKVDIALIETGLGGRLDATNVLQPELSVITSIGIDHAEFLGDTLVQIAREKGGIIKKDTPVVVGADGKQVIEELSLIAINKNAELFYPDHEAFEIDLLGLYQQKNAEIAVKSVQVLNDKFPVENSAIENGLKNVTNLTKLRGRFELLQRDPLVILDAAHNPDGVKGLLAELDELEFNDLHMVYGASSDKDLVEIFKFLPRNASYYFTEFNSKRSASCNEFKTLASVNQLNASYFDSPSSALHMAKSQADEKDLIIVFGSFYLMEEILK